MSDEQAGKWYEGFVAQVMNGLLNADGLTTVSVENDVTLTGKSGATHQIDVLWRFRFGGNTYTTLVECKDYTSTVKKSHMAAFVTTVNDLTPANGVYVTREGFQSGAKTLASHHGIRCLVVNPVLNSVHVSMTLHFPRIEDVQLRLDDAHAQQLLKASGRESFELKVDCLLRDGEVRPLNGFIDMESLTEGQKQIDLRGWEAQTELGMIPAVSLELRVRFDDHIESFELSSDDPARAIIEDVLANTTEYLRDDGTVSAVPPRLPVS